MKTPALLTATLLLLSSPAPAATQVDLLGPPGSGLFGTNVAVLPNGNFVVTDPSFDQVSPPVADVGAVYLYNPEGLLISTLYGSATGDFVGVGDVTVLANGNFVVRSPNWNGNRGAVTWGSAVSGFIGRANVTVSAANSLTGSTVGDLVGSSIITVLTNGNYVVHSLNWTDVPFFGAGAVTWGNGFTGTVGAISAANSLIGSASGDVVGNGGVTALSNGNYVVCSPNWDNGPDVNAGAATWCDGNGGTTGPVTTANSLHGTTANEFVGGGGVTALTNGNYVVCSVSWDNGPIVNAGAITWGNGFTGISGPVTAANSLVGSTAGDEVGNFGITALSNGNYVVRSPFWDNAPVVDVGAVTWGDGFTGSTGPITAANSLVGSTANDQVGNTGVTALTNGNYVVLSPTWDNGPLVNAGAATWGNGFSGVFGPVSSANSLVGTTPEDRVAGAGVTALTNGNYVVTNPLWNNGPTANVGAVTWGNGFTGIKGPVTAANSLVGSTANDQVGNFSVTALTNGHYVVCSFLWDSETVTNAGAVTWGNGVTGIRGPVTAANSLTGSQEDDAVGSHGITALVNGHYLVRSGDWANGPVSKAGAVTLGNGFTGSTGHVTEANSLVGSAANDAVGIGFLLALSDGNCLMRSPELDNNALTNAGAVSFIDGQTGASGPIRSANSVLGTVAFGGFSLTFGYDAARKQMIVGRRDSNLVTLFRADRLRSLGKQGQDAPGAGNIAYARPGTAAVNPLGVALTDFALTGSGSKGKNRALFSMSTVMGTDLVLQSGTPLSALGGGLPFNATATALTGQIFNQPSRALFQATVKGTGISATNNRLLLLDNGIGVSLLHRTGTSIPGLGGASVASFKEVLQGHDHDTLVVSYKLRTGGGVTSANDEGLLFLNHSGGVEANLSAREGQAAFDGGGSFGPFNGRAAAGPGGFFHFTSVFRPFVGKPLPAVFTTTPNGLTAARRATSGDAAPSSGGATFSSFPALSFLGGQALIKATLKGSPASQNEGLYLLPSNTLLTRKGADIGDGTIITRILRFWPAGPGQVMLLAQLSGGNSQALLLRKSNDTYLILLRTGTPAPGVGSAKLRAISAVDVNPISNRYAVLGTLSGSPANSNQALWTGEATAFDEDLRLPRLTLRKGNIYTTDATPSSVIRSIALKPALDPTGAGGRGLAQALGASDDLALFLTGDRNLVETVLLDR